MLFTAVLLYLPVRSGAMCASRPCTLLPTQSIRRNKALLPHVHLHVGAETRSAPDRARPLLSAGRHRAASLKTHRSLRLPRNEQEKLPEPRAKL